MDEEDNVVMSIKNQTLKAIDLLKAQS